MTPEDQQNEQIEASRLTALHSCDILDTPSEPCFDALTSLASQTIGTPIALISLVDKTRQWFKSRFGTDAQEAPREVAFCAHTILQQEIMEIRDATADPRFSNNPLVTGEPNFRFYAGAPLITSDGHALGTLCVIDMEPRELSDKDRHTLKSLATVAVRLLEERRDSHHLKIYEGLAESITKIQANSEQYRDDVTKLFDQLLDSILSLTQSEYGFIGEIFQEPGEQPFLQTHAITNIAWSEETRKFHDDNVAQGLQFRNLETLFGHTIKTGELVISNNPGDDPRAGGRPFGHPDLNAYMGIPLKHMGKLIGMAGIANRPGGYNHNLLNSLQPLLGSIINIIKTNRAEIQRAETAARLRESEERFDLAVIGSGVGLWDYNYQTHEVYWSERFLEILGLSNSEAFTVDFSTFEERLHPDDRNTVMETLQNYIRLNTHFEGEIRLRHEDGSYVWLLARGKSVRSEDGRVIRVAGSVDDITEERELKEKLRRNQEELRLIFDNVPVRIWYKDDKNKIIRLNKQAADSMNLPVEEAEGADTYDLFPEMAKKYHDDDLGVINSGVANLGIIEEYTPKDGKRGWVRTDKIPYTDPVTGENFLFVAASDVTAEKEFEEALKLSEERLAVAASGAGVGIWDWFNTEAEEMWWSPIFSQILGYEPGEIEPTRQTYTNLLHPGDREKTASAIQAHLQQGLPYQLEYRLRHKTKGYRWFMAFGLAIHDGDGNATRMVGSVIDIHKLRSTQALLEQHTEWLERTNQELDQFAFIASHDLKAPLRGINSLAEWIEQDLEESVGEDIREKLGLLRGRVKRMENLLTDILAYSRAGRRESAPAPVDCQKLAEEVIEWLQPPDRISIGFDSPLPHITISSTLLEQVMMNLIGNAIKHHDRPDGHIHIIHLEKRSEHEFVIKDDGPGISEEYHDRVFKMFSTLKPRDQVEGSGIGLAIVKKMIESVGGRVWVDSPLSERGTAFHFTIPKEHTHTLTLDEDPSPRQANTVSY